jgi:cytochrome c oxidase assembly factor CtaG
MARILAAWDPDPSVLIGCALLLIAYCAAHREDLSRAGWFAVGVAVMLFALISPLDEIGDDYLFSAHMIQHLLLILAVPPLLLLGITPVFTRKILEWGSLRRIERILGNSVVAWTIGVGTVILWHAPRLFDAALNNEYIHILEHLCFMVSATIFWWPVLAPLPACRLGPLSTQLYLAAGGMANGLLGIWLTFAPAVIYAPYLRPADSLGIMESLRARWGLTAAVDQAIGGLLMWVGAGFVFVTIMVMMLLRWFGSTAADGDSVAAIV